MFFGSRKGTRVYAAPPERPPERVPIYIGPRQPLDWGHRTTGARGLYRVFSDAVYRLYRSNVGPPVEGDVPYAESASLPATPADTFADGTWWISLSRWNGVIDSGFLPIGVAGATYLKLTVSGGLVTDNPPLAPLEPRLETRAGGVVRVLALYAESAGATRGDTWALQYTTDGSTPGAGAPNVTQAFGGTSGIEVLVKDLPAQVDGTTVKVLVQVRRAAVYSAASAVLVATADAQGPAALARVESWPGDLPEKT